jgi:drug/metabolite transporter (DMT)-like permease
MICFINALSLTTVAAVLIFQAAAPLYAAAMAWLLIGERVTPLKLAAILASMAGVVIMVHGVSGTGGLMGIALSTVMGVTFAGTIVLARVRPDVPTTEASTLAVGLVALASLPMAQLHLTLPEYGLMASFGVCQMGLALIMFTAGIRLIPAADAGLISILETVLAPLWVWLAFAETPDTNTLVGGAVILIAVLTTIRTDAAPLP